MLKVILAEDEDIIREGLAGQIPWKELGTELAASVADGEFGLEKAREIRPDIIITDIKMPFMTGLEFMAEYKKENSDVQFIIISGHDEFEYARQAIRLGAYDYLLKPVNVPYLGMLLRDIVVESNKKSEVIGENAELLAVQKKQLLRDLLFKRIPVKYIRESLEPLGINQTGFFAVLTVQLDDYYRQIQDMEEPEAEELSRSFYQLVHEYISVNDKLMETSGAVFSSIVCVFAETSEEVEELCEKTASNLKSEFSSLSRKVSIGVGLVQKGLGSLPKSYDQSVSALNHKYMSGGNLIHRYDPDESMAGESSEELTEVVQSIKDCIELLDVEGFKNGMEQLAEDLTGSSEDVRTKVRIYGTDLYLASLQILQRQGRTAEEIFEKPAAVYNSVYANETFLQVIEGLTDFISKIITYLVERVQTKHDRIIAKARKKIEDDYKNSGLGLEDIAESVNMSSCYFSVIFKKETGKSVIEYLTEVRIESAKKLLLQTKMMTYEISYEVGYENPTYFSSLFKKIVKESPTDFRKGRMS